MVANTSLITLLISVAWVGNSKLFYQAIIDSSVTWSSQLIACLLYHTSFPRKETVCVPQAYLYNSCFPDTLSALYCRQHWRTLHYLNWQPLKGYALLYQTDSQANRFEQSWSVFCSAYLRYAVESYWDAWPDLPLHRSPRTTTIYGAKNKPE